MQTFIPYLNEAFMLSSCLSMIIGWRLIRKDKRGAHKRWMLASVFLAALFFISYAVKTLVIGDTAFGGPASLHTPYQMFLQTHSIIATVSAVLGILTLRFGFKRSFTKHRTVGRWTASAWIVTTASGFCVFSLLYLLYPPGATVNMLQVWIGH